MKPWTTDFGDRQDGGADAAEAQWPATPSWRDIVCHFNEPQQFGGTVFLVCELEANHPTIMRLALISDSNELELGVREWRGEIQVGVSLNRL